MTDGPRTGHTVAHPIAPRRVSFDWDDTPLHWIPDEPTATHVINVLHLLLPAGERWFVKVFKEALPLVRDAALLKDVKGFMGQEATHSVQHAYVLEHLARQGLDTGPYTRHVDFLFDVLLGERPPFGLPLSDREWLRFRLSVIAATEQFTAVLGNWVLDADGLDRAGPDPVMLDLLRWHGAEEVEHRSVAFDMYEHCGGEDPGRYARRVLGMAVTAPILFYLWGWGTRYLIGNDPRLVGRMRYTLREHNRAVEKGLLPTWRELGAAVPRYLRRSYHPSREGSLRKAVAYLAASPGARAAAGAIGRAAAS
ncbi:metal-dependent hydrolase [Streptomyces albireticuli]|uniref:Metal-dependent hydrolase n=1 Tax=Streptomyces albireticuli TaxID=1940 RepID=A0A2A2D6U8_9ACTN|nr:metal-dependent hydrolase [Streptomyces albireticuli]MCD9143714.1 metal-dependent hydrolase [Streptomyces albireticuli]MCD9161855.1 metal-dependent hydrolase [Streptomyces albireticuli]MCD9191831.1 metal-dependent hydrolase [Streptomyces albireticuli]PAU47166.1 metal-dependent hydrolase [Streptomyces albireticuli]